MAFESVSTPKVYPRYAETKAGTVIAEGLFDKEGLDKFGGPSWHVKSKDKHFVLNSSGHLNYQMRENVSVGDFIRVTYLGTEVMSGGRFAGKESHQFMIERDPERSLTPSAVEPSEDKIAAPVESEKPVSEEKAGSHFYSDLVF